jgi:hypothetical protein
MHSFTFLQLYPWIDVTGVIIYIVLGVASQVTRP